MRLQFLWIHGYFDNVMSKFMINNRADAQNTDVNLLTLYTLRVTYRFYCLTPDDFTRQRETP